MNTINYILNVIFVYQISAQPCDAIVNGFLAILRAEGKQCLAGWGVVFCYYGVSAPLTFLVAFYLGMGVLGIWIAFGIANYCMTITFAYFIYDINWSKVIIEVQEEIKRGTKKDDLLLEPALDQYELKEVLLKE